MMRCYLFRDPSFTPSGFLVVRKGFDPYDDENAVLIQSDWEWPNIAKYLGYQPCDQCDKTDGTVDCEHYNADNMIAGAWDYMEPYFVRPQNDEVEEWKTFEVSEEHCY